MTTVDPDATYTFNVIDDTAPHFTITTQIMQWIHGNLENLKDTNNKTIFGKVNYGYGQDTLKGFGSKPVADVYVNNITYGSDFDYHNPKELHSIVICHLKGTNNHTYIKACELHDYVMQQLVENEDWSFLEGKVKKSFLTNSEIMNNPGSKKWGVIVAFEITHLLY